MKETPLYFRNGSYDLYGVHYEPAEALQDEAFVFVDAFAEEKLWSQRVMVGFARRLAALGYPVLRFDFMGHGDSDGTFGEATVETRLSDIERAAAWLRERSGPIENVGLLGLRFGATLAMTAAERLSGCTSVILWAPVLDGVKYMKEILRANLVTQTAVFKEIRFTRDALIEQMKQGQQIYVEGYPIRYPFYEQVLAVNLMESADRFSGDGLVVQIDKKAQQPKPELVQLKERCPALSVAVAAEELFWKEINTYYGAAPALYETTLNWLKDRK
ncbi:alpha/beta hydrolase [bacterium]|nr:alpha/beta hydrolase [bacterium]